MKWINYEKDKPKREGEYLCTVWEYRVSLILNSTTFQIIYYNGKCFKGYPEAYYGERPEFEIHTPNPLVAYEKVIYWCEIEEPPFDKDLYQILKDDKGNIIDG